MQLVIPNHTVFVTIIEDDMAGAGFKTVMENFTWLQVIESQKFQNKFDRQILNAYNGACQRTNVVN